MNLFDTIKYYGHDIDFEPHSAPEPTAAHPGSEEKIRVLRARLMAGEELRHEGDETITATLESSREMSQVFMDLALAQRAANKVKRADAQPKRVAALHAARATKQRIAEVKKQKYILRITQCKTTTTETTMVEMSRPESTTKST